MQRFLVQMAGEAGSGKSTIARAIGSATGAIVLDKDVIKSAALDAGAEESLAGPLSYQVLFDLARSLVGTRNSLVLDSAAFYTSILERGTAIARAAGAPYYVIECLCPDRDEQARRLTAREAMPSQPEAPQLDRFDRPGTAPLTLPRLVLDTTRPLSDCLEQALEYIGYSWTKGERMTRP